MAQHTKVNLKSDVEDVAPGGGLSPNLEARFARGQLDLEKSGVSYQKLAPGFRVPFGHTHSSQEEIYVALSGGGRMKVGGEVVELHAFDALRVAAGAWRGIEAGDDGLELVVFGARCGLGPSDVDAEVQQGWWSD
jgi:mannose-6-phosphate isomerase-like protein (cupin superfamily)